MTVTRIVIISNTFGENIYGPSLPKADVVIHCGSLADFPECDSVPHQSNHDFTLRDKIDAPVKVAIPGILDTIFDLSQRVRPAPFSAPVLTF